MARSTFTPPRRRERDPARDGGAHGPNVVVDVSRVNFIDSKGLGTLLSAAKQARDAGGQIYLANPALPGAEISGADRPHLPPPAAWNAAPSRPPRRLRRPPVRPRRSRPPPPGRATLIAAGNTGTPRATGPPSCCVATQEPASSAWKRGA